MKAYIDVRGPWPVLVYGQAAIELRGCQRRITVEQAVQHLLGDSNREAAISTDLDLPCSTE